MALGNATDQLVLEWVADAAFPTPTAMGVWLRNALKEKRRRAEAAEAEAIGSTRELLARLERLQSGKRPVRGRLAGSSTMGASSRTRSLTDAPHHPPRYKARALLARPH
jgi:hypothetical protein